MPDTHPLVGYFADANQEEPERDPGLDVPCIVCIQPLDRPATPIKTISLLAHEATGTRSLFFRAHRACWDGLGEGEQWIIESALVDGEVGRAGQRHPEAPNV